MESYIRITSEEEYLQQELDHFEPYSTIKYINEHIPKNTTILVLGPAFGQQYYYPHHKIMGICGYPPKFYSERNVNEVIQGFKQKNVKYILFLDKFFKSNPMGTLTHGSLGFGIDIELDWFSRNEFKDYFKLIYESHDKNHVILYQVKNDSFNHR